MEFTPFHFIDQVLFQSCCDASALQELSSYWGEQADFLLNLGNFDLTIYCCYKHSKISYMSNVTINQLETFTLSSSQFLRNFRVTDECFPINYARITDSSIVTNTLNKYFGVMKIIPDNATLTLNYMIKDVRFLISDFLLELLTFFCKRHASKEVPFHNYWALPYANNVNQKFDENKPLTHLDLGTFSAADSYFESIAKCTQNTVFMTLQFETSKEPELLSRAAQIMVEWIRNNERENCEDRQNSWHQKEQKIENSCAKPCLGSFVYGAKLR
ncbi:hypothetical protein L596_025562 [Steinernema carpocapsae]|uniref:Uncharacterized protein n=1 Tax=Steinernema carpocapsae TaxID=34508 RepID=A0A4U5M857_STECR|nr:hypothetical protein L596_025562 [Steinernema carpocapsae]